MRLIIFATVLLSAAAAAADSQTARSGPWIVSAGFGAVHQFESGLDNGGDVSIDRAFGRAAVNYAFDRRTSLGVALSGGLFSYDFTNGATQRAVVCVNAHHTIKGAEPE